MKPTKPPSIAHRHLRPRPDAGPPPRRPAPAGARPPGALRPGQRLVVTATAVDDDGFAIAQGRTAEMAIWQGIPGEAAEVEVRHVGQHRIRSRFVGAEAPSPDRRAPPCPRYEACGSCALMHMQPAAQRAVRLGLLRNALGAAASDLPLPTELRVGPDGEADYRHFVKLAVGRSDMGKLRVGAFRRGSHDLVAIPDCVVATPTLRHAMTTVAHHIIDLDLHPYDPISRQGIMRHVLLRQSRADGRVLCTIVAGRNHRLLKELAARIMGAAAGIAGVWAHFNDHPGNGILQWGPEGEGPGFTLLEGVPLIAELVAGERLLVGPGDFFQINPGVGEMLVKDVRDAFAELRAYPVVDLYCGVGAFTLPLARAHGYAFGVEVLPGAVLRATDSAQQAHVGAEFFVGEAAAQLAAVAKRLEGRPPVVVVDPPKKGLEDGVFDQLLALNPARVAYVSCEPRSLARDLQRFTAAGWTVVDMRAYDLFPETAHLETLVVLDPPERPAAPVTSLRRRVVRKPAA